MHIHFLHQCRACGGSNLKRFLKLPAMPLTDDFIPRERFGQEFRHDIDVFVCADCRTAQTQHDVDMGDYYEDYQYAVGGSQTASHFMRLLAGNVLSRYYPGEKGKKILEVGSGDGMQLLAFKDLGCDVLGYEPSSTLTRAAEGRGIPTIQGLFGLESEKRLPEAFKRLDVVMLSYTFDHLPQPREFIRAAKSILNPETGLLVVEIHDLQKIFERQEYCLFEHEHSIYLTTATASALCAREGMTVIDFDLVPEAERRANSLIFVATPAGSQFARKFSAAKASVPAAFDDFTFYEKQAQLIQAGIRNLDAFIDRVGAGGKSIAGYGAGGRGVMTLAAMQNAGKLRYLVDKKPKRPGLVAPKSGVPLVGLAALKESPVDEILVFSFGYLKEIQSELAAFGYQPRQFHSLLDILAGKGMA
ncbi:MAG TPA: class I SAM-dependent methyltransferase [Verrucomicrobiae bacterium]|nr:class I SAM-dependent methyltransferase [Verrucomicrobiae bacterium]